MPQIVYKASQGLVQQAGSGISIESADATCSTNAATTDGTSGRITLEIASIAAGAIGTTQTITNPRVSASSTVVLTASSNPTMFGGAPWPVVIAVSNGSYTFALCNVHGTEALNASAAVELSYLVL